VPVSPEQRRRVLDALSSGRLPLDAPKNMFADYGIGRLCMGCDETIGRSDVEYEAKYADGRVYVLHLGCGSLWDAERRRSSTAIEDADRIHQQLNAAMDRAQMNAKQSAQLRDQADVLKAESEATRAKAKQVKRGQQDIDGPQK